MKLTAGHHGVPSDCVVNFEHLHTLERQSFRRLVAALAPSRDGRGLPGARRRHRLLNRCAGRA